MWADALGMWAAMLGGEARVASAHAELLGRRCVATVLLTVGHLVVAEMDGRGRYVGSAHVPLEDVLVAGPLSEGAGGEWAFAAENRYVAKDQSPVHVFMFRPRAAKSALALNGWLLEDLQVLLDDRFGTIPVPADRGRWLGAVQEHAVPPGSVRRYRLERFWEANRKFWETHGPDSGFH